MRIILITFLSIYFSTCFAQVNNDSKIIKKESKYTIDYFTIDKSDEQKNGKCFKINVSSKDTLIIGSYSNNKRVGLWKFKSKANNNDYINYNYDNHSIEFLSKSITNIDSFYVNIDSAYVISKVDRAPIYLGYEDEFEDIITHNTRITKDIFENNRSGILLVSFIIDKDGKMSDMNIENSFNKEFEKQTLDLLNRIHGNWIPAIQNTKPIASKMYIVFNVSDADNQHKLGKFTKKPYFLPINMIYYSEIRRR